jgi:hypothetical protein
MGRRKKNKKKRSSKTLSWADARKRFHLSDMHIQMARELGMNPRKFGGLANHKQEPWKEPLPDFIETLYEKRFKKTRPDRIRSLEQIERDRKRKQAERKARKLECRKNAEDQASQPQAELDFKRGVEDDVPF